MEHEFKAVLTGEGYEVYADGVKVGECLSVDQIAEIEATIRDKLGCETCSR